MPELIKRLELLYNNAIEAALQADDKSQAYQLHEDFQKVLQMFQILNITATFTTALKALAAINIMQ